MELQTQADGGEYQFAYTVNGSGQVTQTDVTNPRGYVRRLTFNSDRFMTSDTHALGEAIEQTTNFTRVSASNLVETETDELGRVTRYTYDSKGNVATVTRLYGTADALTIVHLRADVRPAHGRYRSAEPHHVVRWHYNKATGQDVPTPHTHDPTTPGGVRPPTPNEIPRGWP